MNYQEKAHSIIRQYTILYAKENPDVPEKELMTDHLGSHSTLKNMNIEAYISSGDVERAINQGGGYFHVKAFGGAFELHHSSADDISFQILMKKTERINIDAILEMIDHALQTETPLPVKWEVVLATISDESTYRNFMDNMKKEPETAHVDHEMIEGLIEKGRYVAKAEILDAIIGRTQNIQLR